MKNNSDFMRNQPNRNRITSTNVLIALAILAGMIAMVLSIGSCGGKDKETGNDSHANSGSQAVAMDTLVLNEKQKANAGIVLGTVGKANVNTELQLMGMVEASPQGRISVGSLLGGMVKKIAVKAGDGVKAGQTLCAIENLAVIDWQESYLTAEAEGLMLTEEANRQKELYQGKASSLKNYQQAEAALKVNRAKQEALLQRLAAVGIGKDQLKKGIQRLIWIKATYAGVIESVLVHEGMTVADNANLMELLSDAGAQWVLSGYEGQSALVKVGMSVELSPAEGGASSMIVGRVAAVSPSIQSDRTWKIYCTPSAQRSAKSDAKYRVGQAIKGKIAVQSNGAFVLPEEAVFQRDGKYFCFTQVGDSKSQAFALTPVVVIGQHEQSVVLENPPTAPVVMKGAYALWMMWDAKQSAEE